MEVAPKSELVARPLPRRLVVRGGLYGDAARQPLRHAGGVRNEREDLIDWGGDSTRIPKRNGTHEAGDINRPTGAPPLHAHGPRPPRAKVRLGSAVSAAVA